MTDRPIPRPTDAELSILRVLWERGPSTVREVHDVLSGTQATGYTTVLKLMQKYSDVPMSLADACLVRMTETLADPVVLTTDADFRVYRRHSRHVVPCVTPH